MRNAAVNFEDAFNDGPARKSAPPPKRRLSSRKGGTPKKRSPAFRDALHKTARYGAVGMSATVALAIMCNALVMQKGRHPAPLFGKSFTLGQNTVAPAPAKPPAPVPAIVPPRPTSAAPREIPAPRNPAATPAEPEASTSADPIGRLLRDGSIGTPIATENSKRILGVQRALVKLGFALKPNGSLGPQTKKAIERFEKDRHLPVKGEPTPRLVRILAAESGVRID